MLRSLVIFLSALVWGGGHAQDCATAARLCAQQGQLGDNTGAQSIMPSQCQPSGNALWYTFNTNSQGGAVNIQLADIDCPDIPGMGNALSLVVLAGTCVPPDFTVVAPGCDWSTTSLSMTTEGLAPNTQYWIMIAGSQPAGSTDPAQCAFEITLSGPGADVLGVDLIVSDDVIIGVGESTQLNVTGGSGYTWTPNTGLSNDGISDPISTPPSTITYTVTTEVDGCIYSDEVVVEVIRRIDPPNTFTPNGDGKNDVWRIVGIDDYPGAEVIIFDRWGQRVYTSTGYREPWDGTLNGRRLPDGTYYYHIKLNQLEGRSPPYTGFISIVR